MSFDLATARILANELNEKLRPVAEAPIDMNDPTWAQQLRQSQPLDELGIRAAAEALLVSLLNAYAAGPDTQRAAICDLLQQNSAFTSATGVPQAPNSAAGFRLHLLGVSARWGSEDPRDLLLALQAIYEAARAGGVSIRPIVSEITALCDPTLADMLRRMS